MECGIVGLPNVGKSTLFNALTAAGIEAQNYPFCTIEPNIGVVSVPDPRLGRINAHMATEKIIPATIRLVDIAGLVEGASKGEGLGNKFLANIREVDAPAPGDSVLRRRRHPPCLRFDRPGSGHRGDRARTHARGHRTGRGIPRQGQSTGTLR